MTERTKIKEIFISIQGEGPYIGLKQLFIRFCGCNLECKYCDTEHLPNENYLELSSEDLKNHIDNFNLKNVHSISLTGGEPLIWSDFLQEFLPLVSNKIYLETNATLKKNLEKIIDYIDIISADIKLPSVSGIQNTFAIHDEFFKTTKKYNKEIFAKIIFDENILDDEINNCLKLAEKYDLELILQPKMTDNKVSVDQSKMMEIFNKFTASHAKTRLIPQTHKFLGIE